MASKVKLKPSNQSLSARGLPVNIPVVKRKTIKRKKVVNPTRNVSTADSNMRLSCENGLDRCASLLAAMLESPVENKENIPRGTKKKTLHRSSTPIDNVQHGDNTTTTRLCTAVSQVLHAGCGVAQAVDADVSETNTIDELIEERELLQKYLNDIVHRSTEIEKQVKSRNKQDLPDIDKDSDVTRDSERPTPKKKTKKPGTVLKDINTNNNKSEDKDTKKKIKHQDNNNNSINNSINNCNNSNDGDRTLTSGGCNGNHDNSDHRDNKTNGTDKSELIEIIESITEKLRVNNGHQDNHNTHIQSVNNNGRSSCDDNTHQISQERHQDIVHNNDGDDTAEEVQSLAKDKSSSIQLPGMIPPDNCRQNCNPLTGAVALLGDDNIPDTVRSDGLHGRKLIQDISTVSNTKEKIPTPREMIFKTYRDNLPSFLQLSLAKSVAECCDHSSSGDTLKSRSSVSSLQSSCVESEAGGSVVVPLLVEACLKESFSAQAKENLARSSIPSRHDEHASVQLTTLNYLINELRTMLVDQWSVELERLFTEIDRVCGDLAFQLNTTSCDAEVDVSRALQPLQEENVDLKKASTLLIEHVKDLNKTIDKLQDEADARNEDLSVDLIIKTVQERLGSEQRRKNEMNCELAELRSVGDKVRDENRKLLLSLSDMEVKQQQKSEKYMQEKQATSQELTSLRSQLAQLEEERTSFRSQLVLLEEERTSFRSQLVQLEVERQANEKERSIFNLSLKQRDYEIERLGRLNSDLQESVSKLLTDMSAIKREYQQQIPIIKGQYNRYQQQPQQPQRQRHDTLPPNIPLNGSSVSSPPSSHCSSAPLDFAALSLDVSQIPPIPQMPQIPEMPGISENETDNLSTIVNNVSDNSVASTLSVKSKMSTLSETDFSLWSLATYDGLEFQKNIEHLDKEIKRIQSSIKKNNTT